MAHTDLTNIKPLYGTHGSYGEIFLADMRLSGETKRVLVKQLACQTLDEANVALKEAAIGYKMSTHPFAVNVYSSEIVEHGERHSVKIV
jgi:serine/threonine protein kinase